MRMRAISILVWSAIVCLATPAWAQYGAGRMSDPATGETYHVEIGGYFWDPNPNIVITSQALTRDAIGTPINFVTDLGIEKTKFRQLKTVLRPGRKHRLRFEYTPITYEAVGTLKTAIVFNGIRYPVTFPVTTELKWKAYRFAYEYDFLYYDRGFVGVIFHGQREAEESAHGAAFRGIQKCAMLQKHPRDGLAKGFHQF